MNKNITRNTHLLTTLLILVVGYSAAGMQRDSLTPAAKGQLIAAARSVKLQRGTAITLRLEEAVNSRKAYVNQVVQMSVYGDVIIDNDVVINTNLSAEGIITEVEEPKGFGRPARMTIVAKSVKAVDGTDVPLRGVEISPKGKSRRTLTCIGIIVAAVGTAVGFPVALVFIGAGLFEKGGHIEFGNEEVVLFKAKVAEDVLIKG